MKALKRIIQVFSGIGRVIGNTDQPVSKVELVRVGNVSIRNTEMQVFLDPSTGAHIAFDKRFVSPDDEFFLSPFFANTVLLVPNQGRADARHLLCAEGC